MIMTYIMLRADWLHDIVKSLDICGYAGFIICSGRFAWMFISGGEIVRVIEGEIWSHMGLCESDT